MIGIKVGRHDFVHFFLSSGVNVSGKTMTLPLLVKLCCECEDVFVVGVIEIDCDKYAGGDDDDSLAVSFPSLLFWIGFCAKEINSGGDVFFGVPSSVFTSFCFGLLASGCEAFRFNNEPPGCGVIVRESWDLPFGFVDGMIEISFEKFELWTGEDDGILSYERKRFLTDSEYEIAELDADGDKTKSPFR